MRPFRNIVTVLNMKLRRRLKRVLLFILRRRGIILAPFVKTILLPV